MQGTEKPDRELLDALGLCGALVREGSVYRFLAEHRLRLFGDGLFADLFGGRGRPSVPGSVIAVVMVLQALEGCSVTARRSSGCAAMCAGRPRRAWASTMRASMRAC